MVEEQVTDALGGSVVSATDAASQSSAFIIKFLDGVLEDQVLTLEGRALPYQGVSFGVEQRVKTTYNPGNPTATQQVVGPTEKNTVIQGAWKDIFLGNGSARALADTFRDICRTGPAIEVSWGTGIAADGTLFGKIVVRRGVLKRFEPKFDRPQDLTWEAEFEWRGSDDPSAPPVLAAGFVDEREGFSGLSDALSDALASIRAIADGIAGAISSFVDFTQWQNILDDIQNTFVSAIGVLDAAAGSIQSVSDLASDIIERVRGCCVSLASSCVDLRAAVDAVTGFPDDAVQFGEDMAQVGKKFRMALSPSDDPLSYLDDTTVLYEMAQIADQVASRATEMDASLALKTVPDTMAELRVSAGSDLRDIARKYYGDPDLWWEIADYNGWDSSEVPANPTGPSDRVAMMLKVPRLKSLNKKPFGGAGC